MFTRNKLNVATSRAAHQQVVIAHKHLLSQDKLQEYENKVQATQNDLDRQLLTIYPLCYRQGLVQYCSGPEVAMNITPKQDSDSAE